MILWLEPNEFGSRIGLTILYANGPWHQRGVESQRWDRPSFMNRAG
jgi:hypothetical protein